MSILRFLYQTLCAFLQIKDRKHIEQNENGYSFIYLLLLLFYVGGGGEVVVFRYFCKNEPVFFIYP